MGEEFQLDEVPAHVASVADSILGAQPEPQQHAIDQHLNEQREATENAPVDSAGEPFNPAIHTGTTLKNGTWRRKKNAGPRAAGGTVGTSSKRKATSEPVDDSAAQMEAQARAAGAMAAASVFMIGAAIGGEEWHPRSEPVNEPEMMTKAFGDYFVAKGVNDFPPGVALTLALGMYAAPRFVMPKTRTRVQRFKDWIAIKILTRRLKKKGFSEPEIKAEIAKRNAGE